MKNKQHLLTVVVAVICGYFGGMMSDGVLVAQAAKTEKAVKPPTVITAQEFRIVDEHGVDRGSWKAEHGLLMMSGKKSENVIWLGKTTFGTGLAVLGEEGNPSALLGISSSNGDAALQLKSPGGEAVFVEVVGEGGAIVSIFDATGMPRVSLGGAVVDRTRKITQPLSSLVLFNKKGDVIWQAP